MSQKDILLLSIRDFFTSKMLKFSIAPFAITLLIVYTLLFIVAGVGVDQLGEMHIESTQTTMQNQVPHTETTDVKLEGSAIIKFLMSYAITSYIATFFIYAMGLFAGLYLSIFIAVLVIGFLTPYVIRELHLRHYKDVEIVGYSNIVAGVLSLMKWAVVMILLFISLFPFYFIPVVNIIAFNLPLYYFFHKAISFDISSNISSKEEFKKIKYYSSTKMRLQTLFLYIISLIPFVIFFTAIFYIIYLGNNYFLEVRKFRLDKINL